MHDDAAKTAVLLGHPNLTLLYTIYRECVSREEAVRFTFRSTDSNRFLETASQGMRIVPREEKLGRSPVVSGRPEYAGH
jgi:hypothetical protein